MSAMVTFLCLRHPEHQDGIVGPDGEEQIRRATTQFLSQFVPMDYVFCTESPRTRRTVEVALEILGQPNLPIIEDPYFGFDYVVEDTENQYPVSEADERIKSIQSCGGIVTVQRVIDNLWPPALIIKHVLRAKMEQYALQLARTDSKVYVLVGGHASNTFATLKPKETDGYPPHCSIAAYRYQVDGDLANLVESWLLVPTPLPE